MADRGPAGGRSVAREGRTATDRAGLAARPTTPSSRTAPAGRRPASARRGGGAALDQVLDPGRPGRDGGEQLGVGRYGDASDESALVYAAPVYQEWQRIRGEAATTFGKTYDQDHDLDLGLRRAQCTARDRQDVARAAEAAHQAQQSADAAHRQLAGAAADPLYTALARAGLHTMTDEDHRAVRKLTRHLDAATMNQVTSWLERTRAAASPCAAVGCRPPGPWYAAAASDPSPNPARRAGSAR
ncbi:hypothetical protein [Kitasatospora sp. P5_F3]